MRHPLHQNDPQNLVNRSSTKNTITIFNNSAVYFPSRHSKDSTELLPDYIRYIWATALRSHRIAMRLKNNDSLANCAHFELLLVIIEYK